MNEVKAGAARSPTSPRPTVTGSSSSSRSSTSNRRASKRAPEDPDREPGRDRASRRARVPRARRQVGRRLLDRGRRLGGRPLRRRVGARRPARVGRSYLHIPSIIGAAQKTGADSIPRLRLPLRGSLLRRDLRERGHHLHRPQAGRDGEGRRQGDRARADAEGRPAALPGTVDPVATADDARTIDRRRDRLPGDHQGVAGGGGAA